MRSDPDSLNIKHKSLKNVTFLAVFIDKSDKIVFFSIIGSGFGFFLKVGSGSGCFGRIRILLMR